MQIITGFIQCCFPRVFMVLGATAILLGSCSSEPMIPAAVLRELAPTGKLRVGLFNKNPVYVTQDGGGNQLQGIAPDLARELAARLGVDFVAVRYPAIGPMLAGAKAGEWDVAFLGVDPGRAVDLEYAATYMEDDYTCSRRIPQEA